MGIYVSSVREIVVQAVVLASEGSILFVALAKGLVVEACVPDMT